MKQVKVGLAGIGGIGMVHAISQQYAKVVYGDRFGEIVSEMVADVNVKRAKAVGGSMGFKKVSADWQDIVNNDEIDLVDICTPNNLHYEVAKAALLKGKHVYCEKPLSLSVEQAEELVALAKEKGVVNYVGFNNVLNPSIIYIKELIESGQLGDILRFTGTYDQDLLLDPEMPITWRQNKELAGSGALGDLCSHLLSAAQIMLGDISSVMGMTKICIEERYTDNSKTEKAPVTNDDICQFMVQFANGTVGSIGTSRVGAGKSANFEFEIQGTKGAVRLAGDEWNTVHVYFCGDEVKNRGWRTVKIGSNHTGVVGTGVQCMSYLDLKVGEFRKVMSAITTGEAYTSDFAFGLKISKVIDAVLKSAETRQWVDV